MALESIPLLNSLAQVAQDQGEKLIEKSPEYLKQMQMEKIIEEAKKINPNNVAQYVYDNSLEWGRNQKKKFSGPTSIHVICSLLGIVLSTYAILYLINILNIFTPSAFLLNIYLLGMGISTVLIENQHHEFMKSGYEFLSEWFAFLTVIGGRGLFYVLVGLLCVSIWSLFHLAIGILYLVAGVICVCIHFKINTKLNDGETIHMDVIMNQV